MKTLKLLILHTLMIAFVFSINITQGKSDSWFWWTREVQVNVDSVRIDFPDAKPYINEDSRTMVPIRFISENLGFDVDWNERTRTVTITKEDESIRLVIGERMIEKRSERMEIDTAPVIRENRTMVPVRFISEAMGMQVTFNERTSMVMISSRPWEPGNEITSAELWAKGIPGFEKQFRNENVMRSKKNPDLHITRSYGTPYAVQEVYIATSKPTLSARREIMELLKIFYPTKYQEAYDMMMNALLQKEEAYGNGMQGYSYAGLHFDNRGFSVSLDSGGMIAFAIGTFGGVLDTSRILNPEILKKHFEYFTFNEERMNQYIKDNQLDVYY
jgi:hypothetical protein